MKQKISILLIIALNYTDFYAQFPAKWTIKTEPIDLYLKTNLIVQNDSTFTNEIVELNERLNQMGYFLPKFKNEFSENQIITTITLGKKINFLYLKNNSDFDVASFYYTKKDDNEKYFMPIEKSKLLLTEIEKSYQNLGYPFVKVFFSEQKISNDTLFVQLNVEKGNLKKIDKIIIEGYNKFPRKFLQHIVQLEENKLFDQNKINSISSNLKHITFINETRKPELFFTQDTTYLFLYFDKKKTNNIDGIIGFSNKENGKGIKLDGHFKLELLNSLNKGEYIFVNWISDGIKSQNFKSKLRLPYLLGTSFSLEEKLEMYKKDTTFFTLANNHKVEYSINPRNRFSVEYRFNLSNTLSNDAISNIKKFKSHFVGLSYSHRRQENTYFFPTKFLITNTLLNGKREIENQWQFELDCQYLWDLNSKNKITFNQETRFFSSKQYFENELYRLGGKNNLRGTSFKSIATSRYMSLQTDYHFINSDKTIVSILSDQGYFKDTLNGHHYVYGIGIGYQIITENTVFNLQYMLEKQKNTPISVENSFLNLNISQNF